MPKITIVGRGIDPAKHLSLSAIQTLRAADKIVGIEPEMEFWREFQKEFGVCEIEDLASLYRSQDIDMVNYQRFVDHVLNLTSNYRHLALLVAGHPRLGVTFIELLKKCASENVEIEIIDGISSFDVMITYLDHDPLEQGTVLLDANRLLLFQYQLEPAFSYFIYHVSSIGNSQTNFINPSLDNRVDLFKNYLLKYYPEDKKVFLCRVSSGKNENSTHLQTTVGELDACVSKIDYSTTLYLPADRPSRLDWEYLKLLR